jgi:AcrR family transcriptional regulator
LRAAHAEFSQHGFSGARMDRIVKRARCNIRMVYHHFGKKEELYRSVLEAAYGEIRGQELELHLEEGDPLEGVVRLLDFTFEHFARNPDFVALLNNENLMRGRFVLRSKRITDMTSPLRRALDDLVSRGHEMRVFRNHVDPVQLYVTIAALSWFHLSNAYTLSAMFGRDLTDGAWRESRRRHVRDVVTAYLTSEAGRPEL